MITSTKNRRIVEARKLTQRKHRLRQDRFLVEGLQLLGMAIEAAPVRLNKIKPLEIFYCEELFVGDTAPWLLDELTRLDAEALHVSSNVLNAISDRDTSQGLAATFSLSNLECAINELDLIIPTNQLTNRPTGQSTASSLLLVLDQLQDPGNLGTLIRTADAVGVRVVILLEPCVDPFDLKTVRGTMGSIFTIPFARTKNLGEFLPHLSKIGYHLIGADAKRGRYAWDSDALAGPVALFLGNEARGLSPELHPYLDDYVSLPLYNRVESLNVAIAGGALMYEWLRMNYHG
jgi:TrmH family RNA methyltransferase